MKMAGMLVGLTSAGLLVGCAGTVIEAHSTATPEPSATASPLQTPPESLHATYVKSGALLGEISSARGTSTVDVEPSETGRIAVYVRCYGEGVLTVEIEGAATFDQACITDSEDPGTVNSIDVRMLDKVVVRGSAENSNLWAVAVTEFPE